MLCAGLESRLARQPCRVNAVTYFSFAEDRVGLKKKGCEILSVKKIVMWDGQKLDVNGRAMWRGSLLE